MKRALVWTCAALLLAAAPARAVEWCELAQQPGAKRGGVESPKSDKRDDQPGSSHQKPKKWWIDPELRAELRISDQQSADIEKVWQKSLAQRAETRQRLEQLEAVLEKMILDAPDEAAVIAQLDKVEAARVEANKARVLLLYRINRLLTQDQRVKVDAKVKAMRERDGRRGGPGR